MDRNLCKEAYEQISKLYEEFLAEISNLINHIETIGQGNIKFLKMLLDYNNYYTDYSEAQEHYNNHNNNNNNNYNNDADDDENYDDEYNTNNYHPKGADFLPDSQINNDININSSNIVEITSPSKFIPNADTVSNYIKEDKPSNNLNTSLNINLNTDNQPSGFYNNIKNNLNNSDNTNTNVKSQLNTVSYIRDYSKPENSYGIYNNYNPQTYSYANMNLNDSMKSKRSEINSYLNNQEIGTGYLYNNNYSNANLLSGNNSGYINSQSIQNESSILKKNDNPDK